MSVPLWLRCGITNHATFYRFLLPWLSSEDSTLQDLLADLRQDHDRRCDCGVFVEARAWLACSLTGQKSTIGLDVSSFEEYKLDTPLVSFLNAVQHAPRTVHILFEGKQTDFVPVHRSYKITTYFTHDKATVVRTAGAQSQLPAEEDVDSSQMYQKPGLLVVDKSRFISPMYTLPNSTRLPLIRRPKGFGKTTFLSLLEWWCDISGQYNNDFLPTLHRQGHLLDPHHPRYDSARALVLHLDLSALQVSPQMSDEALRSACRSFLDAASRRCYRRYPDLLRYSARSFQQTYIPACLARHSEYTATADYTQMARQLVSMIPAFAGEDITSPMFDDMIAEQYTFEYLTTQMSEQRYRTGGLFIGIDNYTAPLVALGRHPRYESILVEEIFAPIIHSIQSKLVYRAFMVGDSVFPDTTLDPYCTVPLFKSATHDLTNLAGDAFGLTESEIVALGKALFGDDNDFLVQVQGKAHHGSVHESHTTTCSNISYCTRDVLTFAQALHSSPSDASALPLKIRTFIENSAYTDSQLQERSRVIHSADSSPRSTKRKQIDETSNWETSAPFEIHTNDARTGSPSSSSSSVSSTFWASRRPSTTSSLSTLPSQIDIVPDKELLKDDLFSSPNVLDITANSMVSRQVSPQPSISSLPLPSRPSSPTPSGKRQRLSY